MSSAESSPSLSAIADRIESDLKTRLGDAWADALSPAQAQLLRDCCTDAADLQVRALAASTPADQARLAEEKAQVDAQLLNLSAAAGVRAADAFWDVVRVLLDGAMRLAIVAI